MMAPFLVLTMLSSTARYLFELDGAPVGAVTLVSSRTHYRYISEQVYRRTQLQRSDAFVMNGSEPYPESFWLSRARPSGCVKVVAELTRENGTTCIESRTDTTATGTTMGRSFRAQYDPQGQLLELRIGKSRFFRSSKPIRLGQPYSKGFATHGHGLQLTLEPSVEGARWPLDLPRGTRTEPLERTDDCLEVARSYLQTAPNFHLVLGVVVEGDRAFPHAWVNDGVNDFDPTAKVSSPARNTRYLAFPSEQAGQLYLDLLEGRRRLVFKIPLLDAQR